MVFVADDPILCSSCGTPVFVEELGSDVLCASCRRKRGVEASYGKTEKCFLSEKNVDPLATAIVKAFAKAHGDSMNVQEYLAIKNAIADFVKPGKPKCRGHGRHWFTPYGDVGNSQKTCVRCGYVRK